MHKRINYLVYLMVILTACCSVARTAYIFIEVSPDHLIIQGREILKKDFEKELMIVIDERLLEGYKKEELVINLRVDGKTKRGDIADIEASMRRLNVRKIIYSSYTE